MNRLTLTSLQKFKEKGEKFVCLTAYDASFASLLDQNGIEVLLVGDSLGMVIQGHDSTLSVTIENMIYHCQLVHRGSQRALLMVDMPFMSYATPQIALGNAARLMQEGKAQIVKLEGGGWVSETVSLLSERGIPVCAHLGLTPQFIHKLGGYYVQGRQQEQADRMYKDALALQAAGASLLLLECVPGRLAATITNDLKIPVIGIGAGSGCDGQILVLYDLLGITPGKSPSFSKNFLQETGSIPKAIQAFIKEVKATTFPGKEHTFE